MMSKRFRILIRISSRDNSLNVFKWKLSIDEWVWYVQNMEVERWTVAFHSLFHLTVFCVNQYAYLLYLPIVWFKTLTGLFHDDIHHSDIVSLFHCYVRFLLTHCNDLMAKSVFLVTFINENVIEN